MPDAIFNIVHGVGEVDGAALVAHPGVPLISFTDDLEALDSALFGVMSLNGERCTAGSRILIERSVYPSFLARLAERAARVRVGDPADPATEIGALVHPDHYDRVLSYVRLGAREGAAGRGRCTAARAAGRVRPVVELAQTAEVTVGADGFTAPLQ